MKLKEIAEKATGIDKNILDLIDIKTTQDMREVIAEIKNVESEIRNIELKLDSKIESTNHRIEGTNYKIEATNQNIKTIYWVVGITGAIISTLLAIIALKK